MDETRSYNAFLSNLKQPRFFLKRNCYDVSINAYNKYLLFFWNANMDIQFCLNPYAVAVYICPYIAKTNLNVSKTLSDANNFAFNSSGTYMDQLKEMVPAFVKA